MVDDLPVGAAEEQDLEATGESGYHVLDDWVILPVLVLGVILAVVPSLLLGQQVCLPLLPVLVIAPLFLWAVRVGRPQRAITLAVLWALALALTVLMASLLVPERAGPAIWRGLEARTEVLTWISTGVPPAGEVPGLPLNLPAVVLQALVVLVGSPVSAGLAGLIVDALTINATSYVAANLMAQASNPLLAGLVAWPIWTMVRILGYIICGAVLAEPFFMSQFLFGPAHEPAAGRPASLPIWWQRRRRLLLSGLGLVLLAIVLQLVLGPPWTALLRRLTGLEG